RAPLMSGVHGFFTNSVTKGTRSRGYCNLAERAEFVGLTSHFANVCSGRRQTRLEYRLTMPKLSAGIIKNISGISAGTRKEWALKKHPSTRLLIGSSNPQASG